MRYLLTRVIPDIDQIFPWFLSKFLGLGFILCFALRASVVNSGRIYF